MSYVCCVAGCTENATELADEVRHMCLSHAEQHRQARYAPRVAAERNRQNPSYWPESDLSDDPAWSGDLAVESRTGERVTLQLTDGSRRYLQLHPGDVLLVWNEGCSRAVRPIGPVAERIRAACQETAQ